MDVFFIDSWDLNKPDKQNKFFRQAVAWSREFVPLEYFSQTRCLELLIHLKNFLKQPVTFSGELVPHERFSQTSSLNLQLKNYLYTVVFQDKRQLLTTHAVFPLKVCLAFYGCSFLSSKFLWMGKIILKSLQQIFRQYFICIATVKLLQFLRSFQIILFNTFHSNAFFKSIRESYMWEMWYPNYKA